MHKTLVINVDELTDRLVTGLVETTMELSKEGTKKEDLEKQVNLNVRPDIYRYFNSLKEEDYLNLILKGASDELTEGFTKND